MPTYVSQHGIIHANILNHPSITNFVMGFILSTYQIGSLIISPIVGLKMNDFGRKNCIVGGFFLIILATVGFGTLAYVLEQHLFFAVLKELEMPLFQ